MSKIIVVGTGGLAREFSSYFSEYLEHIEILGFSSANRSEHAEFNLPGILFKQYPEEITPDIVDTSEVVIAIGNPAVKLRISEKLRKVGFTFPSIAHHTSIVSDRAIIEEGVVISPNCVVSPNVTLKAFTYVNFSCGIGHDAIIGRCVQINSGSQLGGFSKIGDGCLVGSGAVVLQGVTVGDNATIASGSVVFSRVSEGATMMGNPAKRMRAFEK
jgi:sugar O-acyltransferase (sialic acid O-acetyltransferase NeuD family)